MTPQVEPQTPASRAQKAKALSELATKTLGALIVLGMVACILILVVRQANYQDKAATTLQNTQETKQILQRLIDCTTAGHDCYDRGAARTAQAVSQLGRVSILASACAARLPTPTPANVRRCVVKHLR